MQGPEATTPLFFVRTGALLRYITSGSLSVNILTHSHSHPFEPKKKEKPCCYDEITPRTAGGFLKCVFPGPRGHRVEVCQDQAVDELLRGGGHPALPLQHHPQPQVRLVPHLLDQEAGVQEDPLPAAQDLRDPGGEYCYYY